MEIPDEPDDILGLGIYRRIKTVTEISPDFKKFVDNLNENILLSTDYYDFMIKFKDENFEVTREIENPTIIIKIKIEEFFKIMEKRTSMVFSFLKGKMKFKKGLTKLFKVYKLFGNILS
ncbi:MAG: hypothetical protein ACTSWR_03105 [Candidatus Helarchaeota archaeon]